MSIGLQLGLTGPVAAATETTFLAMSDYFDYVNDEGLVPDVNVKLWWIDTGTDEPRQLSAYERFRARGTPLIITIVDTAIFRAKSERDQIPFLAQAPAGCMYPPTWIYTIYPTWAESFATWCKWARDTWQGEGKPSVTVIGPDGVAGPRALEPAREYIEGLGVDLMPPEYVAGYVPLDTTTQLLRMADSGTDYVYILPLSSTASIILQDAQRLGLIGEMIFGGLENTQGEVLLEQLGPDAEGYTAPRNSPFWSETDIPGVKLMQDLRTRYGRKVLWAGDDNNGIVSGMIVAEALRRAIEAVGPENVDGPAMNAALLTFRGFDCDGLRTISYTAEDHRGSDAVRIYQVQNGRIVPITDWMAAPIIPKD